MYQFIRVVMGIFFTVVLLNCGSGGGGAHSNDGGLGGGDAAVGGGDAGIAVDARLEDCVLSPDLDTFITNRMEETNIPGLAAGIVTRNGLVWAKGYGFADIAASRAVTKDTIFAIMSISKVVTSVGVMQLVESGEIDLDTNINNYLDAFDIIHPAFPNTPVTTRQLLAHTSGLAGDDYGILQLNIRNNDEDVQPLGEMLRDLLVAGESRYDNGDNYSADAPGTAWVYSSIGMSLAGFVAESVSGTGFAQRTAMTIFDALGMNDTSWRLAPYQNRWDEVAVLYVWDEVEQDYYDVEPFTFADYPAGSIRSSVSDLSRFFAAMINDGAYGGARILSAAASAQMREVQFPEINSGQGIGWQIQYGARILLGHGGDDTGASTDMLYDIDTGKGAIILMNVTRRPETDSILFRLIEETDNCN